MQHRRGQARRSDALQKFRFRHDPVTDTTHDPRYRPCQGGVCPLWGTCRAGRPPTTRRPAGAASAAPARARRGRALRVGARHGVTQGGHGRFRPRQPLDVHVGVGRADQLVAEYVIRDGLLGKLASSPRVGPGRRRRRLSLPPTLAARHGQGTYAAPSKFQLLLDSRLVWSRVAVNPRATGRTTQNRARPFSPPTSTSPAYCVICAADRRYTFFVTVSLT